MGRPNPVAANHGDQKRVMSECAVCPQDCKSDDNRTTASASGAYNVHGWDVTEKEEEALASAKVWDGGPRCEEHPRAHPRGPAHQAANWMEAPHAVDAIIGDRLDPHLELRF